MIGLDSSQGDELSAQIQPIHPTNLPQPIELPEFLTGAERKFDGNLEKKAVSKVWKETDVPSQSQDPDHSI